jgi:hypothetical protein
MGQKRCFRGKTIPLEFATGAGYGARPTLGGIGWNPDSDENSGGIFFSSIASEFVEVIWIRHHGGLVRQISERPHETATRFGQLVHDARFRAQKSRMRGELVKNTYGLMTFFRTRCRSIGI